MTKIIELIKFLTDVKEQYGISNKKINDIISCYKNNPSKYSNEKEIITGTIEEVKLLKKELDKHIDIINKELKILVKIKEILSD